MSLTLREFLSGSFFGTRERLPVILQSVSAECGLACVAMVASYFGYTSDMSTLRLKFPVSQKGLTLANVIDIAAKLNFVSRALRVEMEYLHDIATPCILHWDFGHFVVLKQVSKEGIVIHDPEIGVRTMSFAEASNHFTGVALEMRPSEAFKPQIDKQRVRLRDLMGNVIGLKGSLAQLLILALALEVLAVVNPFFIQWVVDSVLLSSDRDLLITLGVGFILLTFLQQGLVALRFWVVLYVGTLLKSQWMTNVFAHLLKLPPEFFEKRFLGDIVSRFQSVNTIQSTLTTSFVEVVLDGLMAFVTLTMMYIYSPVLASVAIVAVLIYAIARWIWYAPLRSSTEEQIVHSAKQQTHFFETVRGVRAIQLFGRQNQRRSTWHNLLVNQLNADLRTQRLTISYRFVNGTLFGTERIVVIWIGALLVLENKISVGMLFAFVAYKDLFAARVNGLIDKFIDLKMLQLQGERLADIVLTAPEHSAENSKASQVDKLTIELRNVSFRYSDSDPYVLNNITLIVEPGDFVAIVGPSGCGKTTLFKIMLGLLKPTEGEILIGGIPLKQFGVSEFRELIGAVMQDDYLFAGTLADNISFFDPNPDNDRVSACARFASIDAEIAAMPMGFSTLIGDMGSALSGGQQQRVVFARALYKQPQILLLDEATSHLDVALEKSINISVQQLALTRIIIAHRPETIAAARRIVHMQGGKIVDDVQNYSTQMKVNS